MVTEQLDIEEITAAVDTELEASATELSATYDEGADTEESADDEPDEDEEEAAAAEEEEG
jgi:hypothetical protein